MLLSLFSVAHAQAAPAGNASMIPTLLMMAALFAVMYFLMIRPQQKRQKEHQALLSSIKKGDEIITAAGIIGKIHQTGESFIEVEIATNTLIRVQKNAITGIMPKGTYKGDL